MFVPFTCEISREALKVYRNLFGYIKNHIYRPGFSKQDKLISRQGARNFELDPQLQSLFYLDKRKDEATPKRLVIKKEEKARVFEECHSSIFAGHAGRDNTIEKINSVSTDQIITRAQLK